MKPSSVSESKKVLEGLSSRHPFLIKQTYNFLANTVRLLLKEAVSHFTHILFLYFLAILQISCRFSLIKGHKLHYFYLFSVCKRQQMCGEITNGYIPPRFLHTPCFKYIVYQINSFALIFA